jgi:hypothetical protein
MPRSDEIPSPLHDGLNKQYSGSPNDIKMYKNKKKGKNGKNGKSKRSPEMQFENVIDKRVSLDLNSNRESNLQMI